MSTVTAVVNQKGGVGKTTTVINLATAFSTLGKKILIIDFDPQGNASSGLGITQHENIPGSYDVLLGEIEPEEACVKTLVPNLYILPTSVHLSGAEIELVGIPGRENLLAKAIKKLQSFDHIFIDCPPSLGLLTLNALVAADQALVPMQCEFYALEGLSHILYTLSEVKKSLNPRLELQGVILTMFDSRSNLNSQVASDVRHHLKDKVFRTVIPRNVRVAEAPSFGKPAVIYDFKCLGSQAYLHLAKEILSQEGDLAA